MTLAFAIDWEYYSTYGDELLAGLGRTLLVSSIAVVGAFVIGLVLGAARAHRIPVVSQCRGRLRRGDPQHADPRPDLLPLLRPAVGGDPARRLHRRVRLGDDLGRRVQHARTSAPASRRWPTRYREAGAALGFGPLGDVPQRHAADRRPDRAAAVDQHLHQRRQEHVADVRDRLPGADHGGAEHQREHAVHARDVRHARGRLPDGRLDAVRAHPPARGRGSRSRRRAVSCPNGSSPSRATCSIRG